MCFWWIQLSDFGLAIIDGTQSKSNIKLSGTLGYVAPEYLLDGKPTIIVNYFSCYGICIGPSDKVALSFLIYLLRLKPDPKY